MAAGRAVRDLNKQQYWLEVVQRWQASGLSQMEFCRKERVSDTQFYSWRKELIKRGLVANTATKVLTKGVGGVAVKEASFVPVVVKPTADTEAVSSTCLEVVTPGGYVVRIP